MKNAAELAEKVEALYRKHLKEHFGDTFVFDPIWIAPKINAVGRDSFKVIIVYEGKEGELPDPRKGNAVLLAMSDPLMELGLPMALIESYVPKREFPMLLEMMAEPPWGVDDDDDYVWEDDAE